MRILAPIRLTLMRAAICVSTAAMGQALPATPPTAPVAQPATPPVQPVEAAPLLPAQQPPQRAEVTLSGGMLTIKADNSSLNQILRDISQATGMKITGGVMEERVYGSYGPADPSAVLTALMSGTGSNIMIVVDDNQALQELVLTPRSGGPTPPNPAASRARAEEDLPPQRMQRVPRTDPLVNPQQNQAPQPPAMVPDAPPAPTQDPAAQTAPAAPVTDTTTQQSPNGVKTPQEIYDQLMKMQQLKNAQSGNPPQNPPQ